MSMLSSIKRLFASESEHRYVLAGATDWHSHVLPGVDDGVQTLDESLRILRHFESAGLRDLWLTPHIMEDMPNTTADLRARFEELSAAYDGEIRLHLASENMLDSVFVGRLAAKDFLPIGSNADMLLVETSYFNPPSGLDGMLFSIHSAGLKPLLAHPERYVYMDLTDYDRLHGQGIRFQLNLLSLLGHYGPVARAKARDLLKKGYYYCAGSDIHHLGHLPLLDSISPRKNPPNLIDVVGGVGRER